MSAFNFNWETRGDGNGGRWLVIYVNLNPANPSLSSTGKHLLIATTRGPCELKGAPLGRKRNGKLKPGPRLGIKVNLNVMTDHIPAPMREEARKRRFTQAVNTGEKPLDLFAFIRANGGIAASEILKGEYRAIPLHLKNRNGLTLSRMAERIGEVAPELLGYADRPDALELVNAIHEHKKPNSVNEDAYWAENPPPF